MRPPCGRASVVLPVLERGWPAPLLAKRRSDARRWEGFAGFGLLRICGYRLTMSSQTDCRTDYKEVRNTGKEGRTQSPRRRSFFLVSWLPYRQFLFAIRWDKPLRFDRRR